MWSVGGALEEDAETGLCGDLIDPRRGDVGGLHHLVQGVGITLFVEVYTVFAADFAELFRVEKLRERFVFVRGGLWCVEGYTSSKIPL